MARRGEYAKSAARRDEILDAALEVVGRAGYQGLSLRQVADATGMSTAGLLHHFGSREALLAAILERRERIRRANAGGVSPVQGLATAMRQNTEVPGLVQLHSVLAAQAAEEGHPAHAHFEQRYRDLRTSIASYLDGRGVPNADTTATIVIALADGLQLQWMLDPSIDMAHHFDHLLALLRIDDGAHG